MQTNEPQRNRLLVFKRASDGTLTPSGAYETGGASDGHPHLNSQGSVVLTGDGQCLLVTNTSRGEMSVFAVDEDGLSLVQTVATGSTPKSVTEHAGLVYVLNTGHPSLTGLRLSGRDVEPAQVGFSPDDTTLVATERGTNTILAYPVDATGHLGEPLMQPSSGSTPYGFAFTQRGGLIVTEAFGAQKGKTAAAAYLLSDSGLAPASRSVGNGRSEICWAVATNDDRYLFTTNFADGALSRYSIGADGSITLGEAAAGLAVDGQTGLRDVALSRDNRFLYAIDADSTRVFGWAIHERGSLSPMGSWEGPPATVAGLAVS